MDVSILTVSVSVGVDLPPGVSTGNTLPTPGITATAPGRLPPLRLDGGMSCGGRVVGRGSFSIDLYTRCIAYNTSFIQLINDLRFKIAKNLFYPHVQNVVAYSSTHHSFVFVWF